MSRSEVIYFKSYCSDTHTHTYYKVVSKNSEEQKLRHTLRTIFVDHVFESNTTNYSVFRRVNSSFCICSGLKLS